MEYKFSDIDNKIRQLLGVGCFIRKNSITNAQQVSFLIDDIEISFQWQLGLNSQPRMYAFVKCRGDILLQSSGNEVEVLFNFIKKTFDNQLHLYIKSGITRGEERAYRNHGQT